MIKDGISLTIYHHQINGRVMLILKYIRTNYMQIDIK
jgi:hypothetical protein